jgi:phosphate:Na+ symporter
LLAAADGGSVISRKDIVPVREAADALQPAQVFMSDVSGPPESQDEQRRLMSTVHALDNASRLAEMASNEIDFRTVNGGPGNARAAAMCTDAMRSAAYVAGDIGALPGDGPRNEPRQQTPGLPTADAALDSLAMSTEAALDRLAFCAKEVSELRRTLRSATLGAVANGSLTAGEAIARADTVRSLEALAHYAWRSAAHLVGRADSRIETQGAAN